MISHNIPDHVTDRARKVLRKRTPNYCIDCGSEMVLAGGADERTHGMYDHIDPVVMCGRCGQQTRHGAAFEQDEGHLHYTHNIAKERGDELFSDIVAWCNLHTERMLSTKTLLVDGQPARQFKCEQCDQLATILHTRAQP